MNKLLPKQKEAIKHIKNNDKIEIVIIYHSKVCRDRPAIGRTGGIIYFINIIGLAQTKICFSGYVGSVRFRINRDSNFESVTRTTA